MVPFSFPQTLLKSRVMNERLLPSSPFTGAKRATLPSPYLVGQTCWFAPIKKPSCLSMLPSKNLHEPNLFPGTHTAHGILHFLSLPIRGFKKT
jgi:hypothetical protein